MCCDKVASLFTQGVNPLQIAMEMKRHGLNPDMIEWVQHFHYIPLHLTPHRDEEAELPADDVAVATSGGGGDESGDSDGNSHSDNSDDDSDDSFDSN